MVRYIYRTYADEVLALFPATTAREVKPAFSRLLTEMGFAAGSKFAATCVADAGMPVYLYKFTKASSDASAAAAGGVTTA